MSRMSRVTETRDYFKPIEYPWALEAFKSQQAMHWVPDEVSLGEDVKDWNNTLTDAEKNLLTQIFRFFTQGDIDVANGYIDKYLPVFKKPELRMMMTSFAAMEAVHVQAYSYLLDTIGMHESEYQAFKSYKEMADKHEFIKDFHTDDLPNTFKSLAVYSAFTEGLQLFSSFAILLNFSRFGKMKGMGQIVTWSIRDESLHVESMIKLFNTMKEENPHLWTKELKKDLYDICREMVILEDAFIDLAFSQGGIEGLTSEEVKQYVRYTADVRLVQLGLKPNYNVEDPIPWLEEKIGSQEHTNFFENTPTEYSKASTTGTWEEAYI
jgi:ribonucleoside-diphosphate reductase beta chain